MLSFKIRSPMRAADAFARGDFAGEAGHVQRLDRRRNDDGQKQHRRQHLRQREGGSVTGDA